MPADVEKRVLEAGYPKLVSASISALQSSRIVLQMFVVLESMIEGREMRGRKVLEHTGIVQRSTTRASGWGGAHRD